MPRGQCRLCQADADLQLSHILPAFVFRWLRESAGGNPIRNTSTPNLRVQDGLKRYWLCSYCEGLFGASETTFANELFYPYLSSSGKRFRYGPWLLHFCTSVSWRVLRLCVEEHLNTLELDEQAWALQAETVWREYLLGRRPHPGAFQQHLLPLDRLVGADADVAPNMNRYLMRVVQMDLCRAPKRAFTFSKLGRFIILGFIHEPNLQQWQGPKVHANEGFVRPRRYVLPRAFGAYLNEKARSTSKALDSVSDRQQAKIDETLLSKADLYVRSDALAAMQADIEMFGSEAFSRRR